MSDTLNLKLKSKRINVTLGNPLEISGIKTERDENYFEKELTKHYEKGFNEAEKLTAERLEKEYSEKIKIKFEDIDKAKQLLENIIPEYERSFEQSVINVSILVAEKIVQKEISKEPIITDVLKSALKKIIGANNVIVKLNPADYKTLGKLNNESFSIDSFEKIKFEQDDRIEQGGCFIDTEIGSVDARIASQLNELRKQLEVYI